MASCRCRERIHRLVDGRARSHYRFECFSQSGCIRVRGEEADVITQVGVFTLLLKGQECLCNNRTGARIEHIQGQFTYITNGASRLQTKLSDREGYEARRVGE